MKKIYEKPSADAIEIALEGAILDGSQIQGGEITEESGEPLW